jgi:hypothetical protein
MVANQYNDMNRAKIAHEMATYQTVMPSPAGAFVNGYEPVVGSGVGVYEKGDGDRVVGSGNARGGCNECHGGAYRNPTDLSHLEQYKHRELGPKQGFGNLGLQPDVRVALALGAGLRGNRTSKHGCLDRHDEFNNSGKSNCPKGHEVCSCGSGNARGGKYYHDKRRDAPVIKYVPEDRTKYGGKGFKPKPAPRKAAPKPAPKKAAPKKEEPKKDEPKPKSYMERGQDLVKGIEEGVKGVEKAVEIGQKVAPYVEKAPEAVKSAFNTVKGWFGRGNARGGKKGVSKRNTHAEKVRGVSASGNARGSGNARADIVRKVMKDKGLSMIKASSYVKEHDLYKPKASGGRFCRTKQGKPC